MSQKSTTYTTLQKIAWRALTTDYTELSNSYGDDECFVCLTKFEAAWLQGMVEYFRWRRRWTNLTISEEELNERADSLENKLMACIDFQGYQQDFIYQNLVTDLLQQYQDAYDLGGIPQLNPDTPTDFYNGDDSQDRNDALCTAVKIYCYTYAQNWITQAQISLGLSVVATFGASLIPAGGIIAMLLLAGKTVYTTINLLAMQDETALIDVLCCMRDNLTGQVVNQTNFEASLTGCGFTPGSNQEIIASIIASDLDQQKNWLTFLNSLGDSYILAQNNIVDCPCSGTWEHTFDFTIDNGGWFERNFVGDVGANYIGGVGWSYKDATFNASDHRRAVSIKLNFPQTMITALDFVYDYTKGSVNNPPTTARNQRMVLSPTLQAENDQPYSALVDGSDILATLTATHDCDEFTLYLSSSRQTGASWSGNCVITSCTVRGTGINPF